MQGWGAAGDVQYGSESLHSTLSVEAGCRSPGGFAMQGELANFSSQLITVPEPEMRPNVDCVCTAHHNDIVKSNSE
jgi:hypothetical protein